MGKKTWFGRFNENNPRVVMLGIFMVLLIPTFVMGDKYVKIYKEEYEETKKELYKKIEEHKKTSETWKTKYENIKQKSKIVKIIKPNGEIVETTESEMESDTSITERVKEEMETRIREERELTTKTLEKKFEKLIKERKKLTIELGAGGEYGDFTNYYKYLHMNYQFAGPFSVGGGITTNGEVMVGVGFSF